MGKDKEDVEVEAVFSDLRQRPLLAFGLYVVEVGSLGKLSQ